MRPETERWIPPPPSEPFVEGAELATPRDEAREKTDDTETRFPTSRSEDEEG
ncbi:hypothetical protein PC116_g34346 [Phytophthora cactorum]|nr:hypothetical protein PC116_g34346 [Phytophthora cactorum]